MIGKKQIDFFFQVNYSFSLTYSQPSVHEDIVNKNKLTDAKKVRINQENYHNLNTSVVPGLQNTFRRSILGRYSKCKNPNMPTNPKTLHPAAIAKIRPTFRYTENEANKGRLQKLPCFLYQSSPVQKLKL